MQCSSQCGNCSISSTNCTSCATTYYLDAQSNCVISCPEAYYPLNGVCTICTATNCSSCPGDLCQSCLPGNVILIVSGVVTCQSSCPTSTFISFNICYSCGTNCDVCTSVTSCTQCNNSTSLYLGYCMASCPTGYTSVSGVCTPCQSGCKTCSDINTCIACNSGLTNDGNGTCSYSNNNTVNCSIGYYANTLGNCSQCYPTCQTCLGGQVTDCLSCFSGSVLTNGVCITSCNSN